MVPHVGLEGGTVVLINFNNNDNHKNNNVFSLRGLHIKYKMNLSNKWSSVKFNKKEHIYSTWQHYLQIKGNNGSPCWPRGRDCGSD